MMEEFKRLWMNSIYGLQYKMYFKMSFTETSRANRVTDARMKNVKCDIIDASSRAHILRREIVQYADVSSNRLDAIYGQYDEYVNDTDDFLENIHSPDIMTTTISRRINRREKSKQSASYPVTSYDRTSWLSSPLTYHSVQSDSGEGQIDVLSTIIRNGH